MGRFLKVAGSPFDFSSNDPSLVFCEAQVGCRYETRKKDDGSTFDLVYVYDSGSVEGLPDCDEKFVLKQKLIAVLDSEDDIKLWKMLQVEDAYRHHSINGTILYMCMLLGIPFGFFSGLIIAYIFEGFISDVWYVRYSVLSLSCSFFAPFIYLVFSFAFNKFSYFYSYVKLLLFLFIKMQSNERERCKDLLLDLSDSHCPDRSMMARKMYTLLG